MTQHRIMLAKDIDGQAEATGNGMAILFGITIEELLAQAQPGGQVPPQLNQLGMRRSREAQAATGSTDPGQVLIYLARQRFADAVDFEFDAERGELWMVSDVALPGFT